MSAIASNRRPQSSGRSPATLPGCLFVSLSFLAAGCELPGRPDPANRPVAADQVLSFESLYGHNCAGCHGAEGKMGPAPPLNDALFRSIIPESELESVVANGRSNSLMPAFGKASGGTLTVAQIQVLVHEIKGIPYRIIPKKDGGPTSTEIVADSRGIVPSWGPSPESPASTPSYDQRLSNEPDGGLGSSQRGPLVFSRACAMCHGSSGQGIADGNRMRRVLNDQVALRLLSDQALRRYVITGRPDLGMPNFAGARPNDSHFAALTDQNVADVVALLASWRQEPVAENNLVKD